MTRSLATVTAIAAVVATLLLCGPPAHAAPGKGPAGTWLGVLDTGPVKLRLAFHVEQQPDGSLRATLDSLDQGATGLPVDRATLTGSTVRFELTRLHASFEGKLEGEVKL